MDDPAARNDLELLRQYAQTGSQEAFAQIVRLHVDMVYSTARRKLRDPVLAQDVTQRVFVTLARKAGKLKREVLLGGWLYNAAVLASHDAQRAEARRRKREEKAAQMAQQVHDAASTQPKASDAAWSEAEAVLDEALSSLRPSTRGLLVATFWEGKTAREVGQRLGISEDAVRKRVSRAVDELRGIFARKGVALTSAGVIESLAVKSMLKAPLGLAASSASAATTAASASTGAIGAGTLIMATKAKVAAAILIGVALLGAATVGTIQVVKSSRKPESRYITLANAGTLAGTVRGVDGKPAANVTLHIATPQHTVSVYNPIRKGTDSVTTGPDGRYELLRPKGIYELLARGPEGFAEVSGKALEKGGDFQLQPWGRIEGRLLAGAVPGAKATVQIMNTRTGTEPYGQTVFHDARATTDAQGRFVFAKVAPGEVWVDQIDPRRGMQMRGEYAILDPGKTVEVQIGGVGRAVTGRMIPPADLQWPGDWPTGGDWNYLTTLHRDGPRLVNPVQHSPTETPEQYRAAEIAFGRTPAGKLYKNWQFGRLFDVGKDGSFRIEDLPPGMYGFYTSITEYDHEVDFLENRARLNQNFVVLPVAGVRSDAAQDLGEIDMELDTSYRKGERIAPFDIVTLLGQSHPLKEFSGKHVLIYSFSSDEMMDFQRGELEAFKRELRPWASDSRLAIVWMAWGTNRDSAAAARALGIEGMVSGSNGQMPDRLRPTVGTAMLIGPDQTLMQNHIMSRNVVKILQKHLHATRPSEQPGQITSRSTP